MGCRVQGVGRREEEVRPDDRGGFCRQRVVVLHQHLLDLMTARARKKDLITARAREKDLMTARETPTETPSPCNRQVSLALAVIRSHLMTV